MLNQEFCYWLQGYFEITKAPTLTKEKIDIIKGSLNKIHEPLGVYTKWLSDVIDLLIQQNYREVLLNYFAQDIQDGLGAIFYHVIDNSYDTDLSREEAKKIHDGKTS